jgi:alanyl aminopeptidase
MRPSLPAALAAALLSCASRPPARGVAGAQAAPPAAPARPSPPAEEPPVLQLPRDVRPLRYALELRVVPADPAGFRGSAEIEVELSARRSTVWLHGRDLRVLRAAVALPSGAAVEAVWSQVNADGLAKLELPTPIGPGHATLRLEWEASWDRNLAGLYQAREGGDVYAATQLEAIFARRVFPGFDEPRFKTPFDVTLTVPADAVAVSNAPSASEQPAGEGLRRVRFATTEPLPTYLLFVGVGPFEVVTPPPLPPNEVRRAPLPVRFVVPRGHRGEVAFAERATAAIVPWLERYFAIPFPYPKLDQIAVPEFGAGAMENAGAIAYRSSALLDSAGSSAEDRLGIASIIAHEVAHEWFGDLVTLPWWTDTWLNESFATWMGGRATHAWQPGWGEAAHQLRAVDDVMGVDAVASARAIRQPLAAMSDVWGQFDGMSYAKGSAVLRTFERHGGADRFRDGIRAYLAAHRHATGSYEALVAELSRAVELPLGPAMAGFTDRPGVPAVAARVACGGAGARLLLSQSRFVPRGSSADRDAVWRVPVCARWEAAGEERERCTLLEGGEGALDLGPTCPAWVMPHAGAAAYHRWTLAPPDLARLRTAGLAHLTSLEKISLARNLRAAQQAGTVRWGEAMEAIAALAADRDPEAAVEPAAVLEVARDRLVPPDGRAAVAAVARRLYGPVFARLGWTARPGEPLAAARLRVAAAELLALSGGDPAVRREAARRGLALLRARGGAPARDGALDPALATVAVAAAVAQGGPPVFDAVLERLAHLEDAALRVKLVEALGRQEDPALAARAAGLWRGPEVRPHEVRYLFGALAHRSAGRDALLAEAERDLDALARTLPNGAVAYLPTYLAGGCDAAFAGRVGSALEPRLAAFPQMRRGTSQALERIRICAAERDADGQEAAAYFRAAADATRRGPPLATPPRAGRGRPGPG